MSKLLKVASSLVFLFSAIWAASLNAEEAADIEWHTSAADAWQAMQQQDRPLLLFLTTDGCGFCTRMKKSTYTNDGIQSEISGAFIALKLNADHDVDEAWLERFGIEYFPTTLIISPGSRVIDRFEGYVDVEEMHPRLAKISRVVRRADQLRTAAKGQTSSSEGGADSAEARL